VVRYTFTVMDLHHLLLTGLPAHYINFRFVRWPQKFVRSETSSTLRSVIRILITAGSTNHRKE
jgi:hypothetical protein